MPGQGWLGLVDCGWRFVGLLCFRLYRWALGTVFTVRVVRLNLGLEVRGLLDWLVVYVVRGRGCAARDARGGGCR